ncbi:exodeoxyribonuclease V subunit alpha [Enterobacteriaceae endosymbiont of Donacia semicuprea]|uniref:exodeoxyribonuclease V subunit alpha n=1 Tax=Enterobacteriaceae endosymbiont of Donacia semicuprea TaxID=2675783 RepID=UPI0014499829|nr:exodeoxyribonuclease V subunit alpha [Enterobacteriaceae endosymbiont of Donacia semicuprea]QJC33048.1 exodeoxyribonuclease V subunit alpha [Enterobacteriaceae endosymbiont of Donacia semicuprea]
MYNFLKKLCKIKIIRLVDLYFSLIFVSKKNKFLMFAIALLSNSIGKGNTCLPISKLYLKKNFKDKKYSFLLKKIQEINKIINWKKILLSYKDIISNGEKITPIILENNCLYLYKNWNEENFIVNNFIKNNYIFIKKSKIKNILDFLFKKNEILQKTAVFSSLTHRISIITGSPGTGKTSIIPKIIYTFIKIFSKSLKIKVAAATGKASVKLTESINKFFKNISKEKMNEKEKKNIPSKATTIHSLLKLNMYTKKTIFNSTNILDVNLLIIDESSMIDSNLMYIILKKLPLEGHLILLGDDYQLPSIEYGNIFKDLCFFKKFFFTQKYFSLLKIITNNQIKKNLKKNKFFFRNFITVLKNNYRYKNNSGINKLAKLIKQGNILKIKKLFLLKKFNNINYINILNIKEYELMIQNFINEYEKYFNYLNKNNNENNKIINKFNNYQIICAVKNGLFGTKEINNLIEKKLFNKKIISNNIKNNNWYIGKPIIITQNDNFLNLFNGDIGITYLDKNNQKLKVKFLLNEKKCTIVDIKHLPAHETAYAITAHKSQGSEFKNISLVLPNKLYPLLTRELIYTAITRSKKNVTIYSNKLIFYKSIKRKIQRYSNLKKKIINYMK